MDHKKIYLTKERLEELKQEFNELTKIKRPSIVERVTEARNQGDLSENAEYVAAREELSFIDGRIAELEEILSQVVLIEEHKDKSGHTTIELGSKVKVDIQGEKEDFMIVGEWEADPAEMKISHESPLGKALLGKKVGEQVEVQAPAGKVLYTIVEVK